MLDIAAALREHAESQPAALAIASAAGVVQRAELVRNVDSAAAHALEHGIRAGDLVVVRTLNHDTRLQLLLALMMIGCRVSATQSIDIYREQGVAIDVLVTDDPLLLAPGGGNIARPAARIIPLTPQWFQRSAVLAGPGQPTRSCTLIFTSSGSTGTPKLIELGQEAIDERLSQVGLPDERPGQVRYLIASGPTTHATIRSSIATLTRGGTVFRPRNQTPEAILDAVKIYRPTFSSTTPATVLDLLKALDGTPSPIGKLAILRIGGAYCPPGLLRAAAARLADEVIVSFGSTELWNMAEQVYRDGQPADLAGRLRKGIEASTTDEGGYPLPEGAQGYLRFRAAPALTGRYLHATQAAAADDGWFVSGDIGRVDAAGNLYLLGRASQIINIGGDKINPEIVEAAARSLAGIDDIGVGGIADADGIVRLHAAVVASGGIDLRRLNRHLASANRRFALHAMATVPAIPRTDAGKVDRSALRRLLGDASPRAAKG